MYMYKKANRLSIVLPNSEQIKALFSLFLLIIALHFSDGFSCYTHDQVYCPAIRHPLGYRCGGLDLDNPMGYVDSIGKSFLSYSDEEDNDDEEEEEAIDYSNDGGNFTGSPGCEVIGMMYIMYTEMTCFSDIRAPDISSSNCYWDTEVIGDLEKICLTRYQRGIYSESGCQVTEWYSDFEQAIKGDDIMAESSDEETEASDNPTQYPVGIQATWLETSDTTASDTDYDGIAERNASSYCCHGDTASHDNEAVMRSQSCYECRSDPRGVCGDSFDPSSEYVKEVECRKGCQKVVHPEFVSRGCGTPNQGNDCKADDDIIKLCAHYCQKQLCNSAAFYGVHKSLTTVIFYLLTLLLSTYLLDHGHGYNAV